MSLDAAQGGHRPVLTITRLTTWGVFFNEETNNHAVILLNAIKKRAEYPRAQGARRP